MNSQRASYPRLVGILVIFLFSFAVVFVGYLLMLYTKHCSTGRGIVHPAAHLFFPFSHFFFVVVAVYLFLLSALLFLTLLKSGRSPRKTKMN